jgi:hypothetical protein
MKWCGVDHIVAHYSGVDEGNMVSGCVCGPKGVLFLGMAMKLENVNNIYQVAKRR